MTRRALTSEELEALKAKYPEPQFELLTLNLRVGDIVLRNPSEQEYALFTMTISNDSTRATAFPNLLAVCCVFPEASALAALRARYPGLVRNPKVLSGLQMLAGAADELEGKG